MRYFEIPQDPFKGYRLPLLFSESDIQARIAILGKQISKNFKNKKQAPILIGVLNGSFYFMADLLRAMSIEAEMDFLKISSYQKTKSTGTISLIKDISADIRNRDIVIIEDIIDTGLSMNYLRKHLLNNSPASLSIATLLYKKELANLDKEPDYVGFEIPDLFVLGYGLDINQYYRQLRDIYAFSSEDLAEIRNEE
ncbi:MAG: hypoxanthine phosphoribosyltransferase [Candidatus Marinimicrobia bacterium]|nr:hypoxanthine phosphoribosyltransferase [Candidatus Neomarinimicrobiota bacterium]